MDCLTLLMSVVASSRVVARRGGWVFRAVEWQWQWQAASGGWRLVISDRQVITNLQVSN